MTMTRSSWAPDTPVSEAVVQSDLDAEREIAQTVQEGPTVAELMQRARVTPVITPKKQNGAIFNVQCPECPQVMRNTSLIGHLKAIHGMTGKMPRGWLESQRTDAPLSATRPRHAPSQPKMDQSPRQALPKQPKAQPIDPEALCQTVLIALFPKGVPVSKLRPVSRWIEATDTLIKEMEL